MDTPSRDLLLEMARANVRGIPELLDARAELLILLRDTPNDEAVAKALELATRCLSIVYKEMLRQATSAGQAHQLVHKMSTFKMPD